jgi:AraC-like DNA-binding protein
MQQGVSFRFSTAGMPVPARHQAIGGLRDRGLLPIEPLDDSVSLSITKCFLPGVGILAGTLCGLRQEAAARTKDVGDDLFLGVNLAGRSVASQRGQEAEFGDGEAVLLNLADGGFVITRPTPARIMGLRVPRPALAPLLTSGSDEFSRVVVANRAPLRLLVGYLRAIVGAEAELEAGPQTNALVATHLYDLMALCIGTTRDAVVSAAQSVRAARLEAIKSHIAADLWDPSLTVALLAARQGVTRRYVHKLFESDGTTCTQFILQRRLDRAYRWLCDHRFAERSITSIAFGVGFGDLSYFNRAFRRQYNATPSDIRNRALRDNNYS